MADSVNGDNGTDHDHHHDMKRKQNLGWFEWGRGWFKVVEEFLFQRIMASHLDNPLLLPPLDGLTFIVTGATSGIGLEIARQLAQAGAHVVMAARRIELARDLVRKWQDEENSEVGTGVLLNVEANSPPGCNKVPKSAESDSEKLFRNLS